MSSIVQNITVDELTFRISVGQPFQFPAKHSDKLLSGIQITVMANGHEIIGQIEDVFGRTEVKVSDPFSGREYVALPKIKAISWQNNDSLRTYKVVVTEIDMPPHITEVELNNVTFQVIKYSESDLKKSGFGRHILLKLSPEENEVVKKFIKQGSMSFFRQGIDAEPLMLNVGEISWWSMHEDSEITYYKRILYLFPAIEQENEANAFSEFFAYIFTTQRELKSLNAQYDALLNLLVNKGLISHDEVLGLSKINEKSLTPDKLAELNDKLDRVKDAEDLMYQR